MKPILDWFSNLSRISKIWLLESILPIAFLLIYDPPPALNTTKQVLIVILFSSAFALSFNRFLESLNDKQHPSPTKKIMRNSASFFFFCLTALIASVTISTFSRDVISIIAGLFFISLSIMTGNLHSLKDH